MNLRIYYKYLSSRIASKWTVLLVDVIIVVISMLSACFLQYRLSSVSYEISLYVWLTIWAVLCNICFFHILRTYVGVIRFSSFVDIYRVFWSLTISYAVLRRLFLQLNSFYIRYIIPIYKPSATNMHQNCNEKIK